MGAPSDCVDDDSYVENPTVSQIQICSCCDGYQYAGPRRKRNDWLTGTSLIAIKHALLRKSEKPDGGGR